MTSSHHNKTFICKWLCKFIWKSCLLTSSLYWIRECCTVRTWWIQLFLSFLLSSEHLRKVQEWLSIRHFKIVFNLSKNRLKSLINWLRVIVIPFFLCYQLSLLFTMGVPLVSPFPQGSLSLIFLWSVNKPKFKVSTYNQCKLMIS